MREDKHDGGMANFCCMCDVEITTEPSGCRSGYCSEKCWDDWVEQHQDDAILVPYVPLQVTRLKFDTT